MCALSEPERGRFAVARQFLATGTVLVVEQAAVHCSKEELVGEQCSHCYTSTQLGLVACRGCSSAGYCSTACRDTAFKVSDNRTNQSRP